MNHASMVIDGGAAICGLIASWYWYKSSNVSFWPDWNFEPVVEELRNMGRFAAITKGIEASSKLNSLAARWTAASVILSTVSAIVAVTPNALR